MADLDARRPENVEGNFFVDASCIDCNACRWMAPSVYSRIGEQSAVHAQPQSQVEIHRAAQALVACPTGSIGTVDKGPFLREAIKSFPCRVEGDVYHCGFHHRYTFGAASYLILREGGNLLIDSPRFSAPLVRNIQKLGGVKTMFLTHKDDVGDHQAFHDHFGCERVIHRDDAEGLEGLEVILEGKEPIVIDEEFQVIPVPGHTKGSVVFLYQNTYLFSGDHLAFSSRLNHFHAFYDACWYSWSELKDSMKSLAEFPFRVLLPGHGNPWEGSFEESANQMKICLEWLDSKG